MDFLYKLETYKTKASRSTCPKCGNRHCFAKYVNTRTGECVGSVVGRCNREDNCGYHYKPKQYFADNKNSNYKPLYISNQPKRISTITPQLFKRSLQKYDANYFIAYLIQLFGEEVAGQLIGAYFIGSSKHWQGSTIFWQIDIKGRIRTGRIMLYNPETGKRVKDRYNHITWAHSTLKNENYNLQQCLFGEHLLKADPHKPVALVESEKTAIIASAYLPEFIWLATGGLRNFTHEKCKVLAGRNVALYPDLNAFDKWNNKALELSHLANFKISDFLETTATEEERRQGLDLADYLIRYDYNEYQFIQDYPSTFQQAA